MTPISPRRRGGQRHVRDSPGVRRIGDVAVHAAPAHRRKHHVDPADGVPGGEQVAVHPVVGGDEHFPAQDAGYLAGLVHVGAGVIGDEVDAGVEGAAHRGQDLVDARALPQDVGERRLGGGGSVLSGRKRGEPGQRAAGNAQNGLQGAQRPKRGGPRGQAASALPVAQRGDADGVTARAQVRRDAFQRQPAGDHGGTQHLVELLDTV